MRLKQIFLAILLNFSLLFGLVGLLMAQTDELNINLTSDKKVATIGEVFELTLAITHPVTYSVTIPKLERAWGEVEVRSQSESKTMPTENGLAVTSQIIQMSCFTVGAFQTPDLTISMQRGQDNYISQGIPRLSLMITSILTAEEKEIQPLRPQAELPLPPIDLSNPLWWAMGALVLVTALVYGWLYRTRPQPQALQIIVDPRAPHEIAFDELERISRLNLPAQGQFKPYYILLADCLRTYLEGRYSIPAMDSTSSEIKAALRRVTISPDQIQQIMTLFNECDLGKFAEFTPTVTEADQLLEQARRWIMNNEQLVMNNG